MKKPTPEKRHPHLEEHFRENLTLADKVRRHHQDSKIDEEDLKNAMIVPAPFSLGDNNVRDSMIGVSDYSIVSSKVGTGSQTPL